MSPAELELLLRRVLGEGMQLHPLVYVLLAIVSVFAGIVGAFVGAYFRKRGEHLATKADFDVLLRQVARQTEETESIKAEIAQAGWIHQRRWDLKRQLYWDLLQLLEEIRQKGRWLTQSLERFWTPDPAAEALIESFAKHMYERGTIDKLLAYKGVAGMILSEGAGTALDDLSYEFNRLADVLIRDERPAAAFFDHGRSQLFDLLARTDEVYRLVLAESQTDLLGGSL